MLHIIILYRGCMARKMDKPMGHELLQNYINIQVHIYVKNSIHWQVQNHCFSAFQNS